MSTHVLCVAQAQFTTRYKQLCVYVSMYQCMHVCKHKRSGKPAPTRRTQATGTRSESACRREGRCRASWEPVCNRGVSYHVCVGVSYHVMTGSGHPARAPLVRNQCHTPVISTHIFMSFHNRINIHMCTVAIQMPSLLWSCSVFAPWV